MPPPGVDASAHTSAGYRRGSEGHSCNIITSRPSLNRERNSMSGEQLERSILERKEREELQGDRYGDVAGAGRPMKKADLVDQILRAAGVEMGAAGNGSNGATAQPVAPPAEAQPAAAGGDPHRGRAERQDHQAVEPRARTTKAKAAAGAAPEDGRPDVASASGTQR